MAFLGIKSKKDKLREAHMQSVDEAFSLIKQLAAQTTKIIQTEKDNDFDREGVIKRVNADIKSAQQEHKEGLDNYKEMCDALESVVNNPQMSFAAIDKNVTWAKASAKNALKNSKNMIEFDINRLKKTLHVNDYGKNIFHRYGNAHQDVCDHLKNISGAITDYFLKLDQAVEVRAITEKEANEKKQGVIKTYIEDEIGKYLEINNIEFSQEDVKEQKEILAKDVSAGKVSKEDEADQMKALEALENGTKNRPITLTDLLRYSNKNVHFLNVVLASRQILTRKIKGLANSISERIDEIQENADKLEKDTKEFYGPNSKKANEILENAKARDIDELPRKAISMFEKSLDKLGVKDQKEREEIISKLCKGEENPISKEEEFRYRYSVEVRRVFKKMTDSTFHSNFAFQLECAVKSLSLDSDLNYKKHNIGVEILKVLNDKREKIGEPFSEKTQEFMINKLKDLHVAEEVGKNEARELEKEYFESTKLKEIENARELFAMQKELVGEFIEKYLGDNPIEAYAANKKEIDLAAHDIKEELDRKHKELIDKESRSVNNTTVRKG